MKMNSHKLATKAAKINGKIVSTATKREVQIDYSEPKLAPAPDIGSAKWIVAMTEPRSEVRATVGLVEAGYVVFSPVVTEWRRHGWKQYKRTRPLFPGYLFVGMVPGPKFGVKRCDSVASVISDESGPIPVRASTVMALSDAMMAGRFDQTIEPVRHSFAVGESVTISEGAFSGFVASIADLGDSDRVAVLISILGAERPVSVDAAILRKVGA